MLELRQISKKYQTGDTVQTALDCVDLKLADTEFVAILGPSGSGKTTLLNIIGGLDRYDGGDLVIDGISTKNYSDRDWDAYRNHAVGFVFQSYNLIMHQSVLANVELALTIAGVSRDERRRRAEDALRRVGLGDQMNKKPNQISGGQMQRVAIARALVNNPRIVLADEPTGALDSETSLQVMDILKEVARDRLVVMVTHNPDLAERYATRIVTIRDGRIAGSRSLPENILPEGQPGQTGSGRPAEPSEHAEKTEPAGSSERAEKEQPAESAVPSGTNGEEKATMPAESVRNGHFRRTSMTFLTALSLSFQNLRTKKARTFMVSFAGSIGIIGIALILAIETGLKQYVQTAESATLSQYPIEIYATGIDWTSLFTESSGSTFSYGADAGEDDGESQEDTQEIIVNTMAKDIFAGMNSNDLVSFKKYLESGQTDIPDYATDIEYSYGVEPQIYEKLEDGTIEQLNPNRMLSDMLTSIIDVSSLMNGFVGESLFHPMPSDPALYENSYDVKAGRWPENNHELVLVLTNDGHISDFLLYELGIMDPQELREMIADFSGGSDNSLMNLSRSAAAVVGAESTENAESTGSAGGESAESGDSAGTSAESGSESSAAGTESSPETSEEPLTCTYGDFLGRNFKLILSSDTYVYDDGMKVWSDMSGNSDFMKQLVDQGEDLTIVGIVQAKEDASSMMLTSGIGYPRGLIDEITERERESDPVKAQLADPETDIFTGKKFTDDTSDFRFGDMLTLDHDDVAKAFHIEEDAASSEKAQEYLAGEIEEITDQIVKYASDRADSAMDDLSPEDFIDMKKLAKQLPQLTADDLADILDAAFSEISEDAVKEAISELVDGGASYLQRQLEGAGREELQKAVLPLLEGIRGYLRSDEAQSIIREQILDIIRQNSGTISEEDVRKILQNEIAAYLEWVRAANEGRGEEEQLKPEDAGVLEMYFASSEGQERMRALADSLGSQVAAPDDDQIRQITEALADSFGNYASENSVPDAAEVGESVAELLTDSLKDYLMSEDARAVLDSVISQTMSDTRLQKAVRDAVMEKLSKLTESAGREITDQISEAAGKALHAYADDVAEKAESIVLEAIAEDYQEIAGYINRNIGDFFTIDEEAFRDAVKVNVGLSELQSILSSFLNSRQSTYADNLSTLGYADPDSPVEILIYPEDFNAKNHIADQITAYNDAMKAQGENDKAITYSDVVATMMQSVTDIINAISRMLIAFVSISLVVSSIMIGVITYISVLERRKEIGILRAIGASKHNVREVFNAETVITGFLSGCLGVGLTYALIPLADFIIREKTGQIIHAALLPEMAAALVLLSVLLTLLAGLIPSGKAARSDPVAALRSE